MTKRRQNAVCKTGIALLSLGVLLIASPLRAGDEDMSPSAYHVFDPETGFMVTVDPLAEEQLDAAANGAAGPDVGTDDSAMTAGESRSVAKATGFYLIAALVLIAAVLIWQRTRLRSA